MILVLGHMRSGSTLLLHLLASSPEVIAAGERNTVYDGTQDLHQLSRDCYVVQRRALGRIRYAADQLNHDHLIPQPRLLLHPKVRPIVLVRAPQPSIGSMVRTFGPIYGDMPAERAATYYIDRVRTLTAYVDLLKAKHRKFTFVRYEALTRAPETVLGRIRSDLDLLRPLTAKYAAQKFTGQRGDPSAVIQSGAVRADAGSAVALDPGLRIEAERAYQGLLKLSSC